LGYRVELVARGRHDRLAADRRRSRCANECDTAVQESTPMQQPVARNRFPEGSPEQPAFLI